MLPIIGITCSLDESHDRFYLGRKYAGAVEAGGGVPVSLVYNGPAGGIFLERVTEFVDGLILSGGVDVDPVFFGEEPAPACGEICPERDDYEIALVKRALALEIPVLGICRGIQVMNIAAGGDIYQDISTQLEGGSRIQHFQQAPSWYPTHEITVGEGTMLSSMLDSTKIRVNSFHHQAVRKLAPGFIASAVSADGVVEAVESPDFLFSVGIQCHPETMWSRYSSFLELFAGLVEAARTRCKHK